MTTEVKFPEVLAAVRAHVIGQTSYTEPSDDGFRRQIAHDLRLNFNENGYWYRNSWDRFCAQASRALNKLAEEGVLVKSGAGRNRVQYWTPAAWEEHQQQLADRRASEQIAYQRAGEIAARFAALGVTRTAVFPSGMFEVTAVRLDELTALEALLDLAEKGSRP